MNLDSKPRAPSIGWPLLPFPDQNGDLAYPAALAESVRQQLQVILSTRPGEQLMRPGFGAGLTEFLGEPDTITTRRLLMRRGILNTTGHDMPLNRISEVSYTRSLADRMLGCGTLQVATAAEEGTIALVDVPDVEHVHSELTELLFGPALPVRPTGRP